MDIIKIFIIIIKVVELRPSVPNEHNFIKIGFLSDGEVVKKKGPQMLREDSHIMLLCSVYLKYNCLREC